MNNMDSFTWPTHELSELTTKIIDGTHFTPTYLSEGVPFLRVTDIHEVSIDLEKVKFISEEEHRELIKRSKPEVGDLLLSKNGTIGQVKLINWEWEFSIFVSLALIKPRKELVDPRYLKHVLSSEIVWQQIRLRSKQGAVTNLHLEEIREFKIPLPPMSQQTKIAEILEAIDEVINQTRLALDKLSLIKKGMMHDLFFKGIMRYSENELASNSSQNNLCIKKRSGQDGANYNGGLPNQWHSVCLDDLLSDIIDYRGKTPVKTEIGVPLVTAKNIKFGYLDREPREYIAFDAYDKWMTRGIPRKGDILFTTEAPLGNVAQIDTDERIAFAQRVIILKTNELCDSKFLKYLLLSDNFRRKLFSSGSGSTVEGIKQSEFKKIRVGIPESLEEQIQIAAILDDISERINIEEVALNKYEKIKKGLMQDLLTGKVKVS